MNRRLWWVLLIVLVASMTLFTACEDLLNPEEDTPEDAQIDAALVGRWVTYSTDAEVPENAEVYSGVQLNSDGSGTSLNLIDYGTGTPDIEVSGFTWSAADGELQINTVTPAIDTMYMAYTLASGNNVVTIVGTDGDGTGQATMVKFQPNQDASLVGTWLVETPAEDAGTIISLADDGSGSYTEPGAETPDVFSWGTNSGYIGILVYQDLAGYVASYSVTSETATLTFSYGTMTLTKLDTTGGGGGGGTIDSPVVGTWLLYGTADYDSSDGDNYATLTLRDDGTGAHVSVWEDWESDETHTEAVAFTYTVDGDSLEISFINPPPDMPDQFKIGFALFDENNMLVVYGTDGMDSEETYVRFERTYDPDVLGTWYVASPYDELDAQIVLNDDGTGSYTDAAETETEYFTWGTNAGYIGILLYDNVGMVATYEVQGDNMTFGTGFGTMLLSRTSSGTGGGGVVVTELVGTYVLYTFEYMDAPESTPVIKQLKKKVASSAGVDYVEGVSMEMNGDGTGALYFAWYYDGLEPEIETVPFTWGEVIEGYLLLQFDEQSMYEGESFLVEYSLVDDLLSFIYGDEYYGASENYYRLTDNRPSMYYGDFFYFKEILDPPINTGYHDMSKITLRVSADAGVAYRKVYLWDDVNQEDMWVDVVETFDWSITADGYHFVQYDGTNHMGRVVEFDFAEVDNSARLEASAYRWEWDEDLGESVQVQATSIFYRNGGLNSSELGGDWVAAEFYNDMYETQAVPRVNVMLDAGTGMGTSLETRWDDDMGEEVLEESSFYWFNADDKLITHDEIIAGEPFYGEVIAYSLDGNSFGVEMFDEESWAWMMMFFVKDTGVLDPNIGGDWVLTEFYENETATTPDPNGALYFGNDGRGSYTRTDEWDGTTVLTDEFSYSTQYANELSNDYVIVDVDEPAGEPTNNLREAYEYLYDSVESRLHLYTKMWDEWGNTVIYHEIYTRPTN